MKKIIFKHDAETGRLSEKDTKKYFSTLGFAVFSLVTLSVVSVIAVAFVVGLFAPSLLENDIAVSIISMVSQYGIAFPVCIAILRKLPKDVNPPEKLGLKNWFACLFIATTFMSVGSYISEYVIIFFEKLLDRTLLNPVAESTSGMHWAVNLVFVAIIPPIIEELLFRKIICDRLLPLGEGYAVVLSAVIFGLVHGNFFQFFYAFLLGLLFSAIYVKTGRVRYTVIYHMLINFFGGVFIPWVMEKLEPILEPKLFEELVNKLYSGDTALMDEAVEAFRPYLVYFGMYSAYSLFMTVGSFVGVFLLVRYTKRFRLREGLLRPAAEGRIANIFCNVGVAAAITAFVGLFIYSFV